MQPQNSQYNTSIGSLMRQNLEFFPQKTIPKIPAKKSYKYPYMDSEAINETIQKGKNYMDQFNQEQDKKSSGINKMNRELRQALKDDPHTIEEKVLFQEFKKKHKLASKEPMAYNQKVLEFNRKHGTHFYLRTYPKLKNEITSTWPQIVNFYAAQIRANNARKLNARVTTAGTLPRMLTNSESIKRHKVKGVPQCPYQNDAILSHIHKLVEAGILINYKSHGRNMGFSVEFNPEILEVKDQNFTKLQNTDKQSIIKFKTGKPTYSDCITRTGEDKNENKGDAPGVPDERNGAHAPTAATGNTYKVTKSEETPAGNANFKAKKRDLRKILEKEIFGSEKQEQDSNASSAGLCPPNPPRQEQKKPGREISEYLENRIQETWPLCVELSENKHIHHVPPIEKMEWEASNGILSQPVFGELIFQEFMKVISRLKKTNQSAAGAFYRGFEELEDQKLKNFAGRYFTKVEMLKEFKKWLKCVDFAERWAKKREFNLLFINDYLDTQRRDAKEMGFWYVVEKIYVQEEKKKLKRKEKRARKAAEARKRKQRIKADRVKKFGYRSVKPGTNSKSLSDYDKARKKVRKYIYGDIPFEELDRYCRHNLNQTIVEGLGNLIEAERANLMKYKV